PITISHGTNQLVGTDPHDIRLAVHRALSGEIAGTRPDLWDGHSAERCVDALLAHVARDVPHH
nr:hypothetical protein [Acidimicrobiales bacterium]